MKNKFYCNICNKDVDLVNGKCPDCKTDWEKIIRDSGEEIPVDPYSRDNDEVSPADEITETDIKNNISFFLNWSKIEFWSSIIVGAIFILFAFIQIGESEGMSLFLIIPGLIFMLYGKIIENVLKWNAYMLHTNVKKK